MATDYAESGFSFTDLRVEEAFEYCRRFTISRREWRDTSTGTDGTPSGLTLVCGTRTATFFLRFRRAGKTATAKIGPAAGRGKISVEEARRQALRIRFGGPKATSTTETRARKKPDVGVTVKEAFDRYIAAASSGLFSMRSRRRQPLKPKTVKGYKSHFNANLAADGARDVRWLAENVRAQFEDLGTVPDDDGETHPAVANQHVAVCRAIFAYLRQEGIWTEPNPVIDPEVFEKFAIRRRSVNLTGDQAARFVTSLRMEEEGWRDLFMAVAMLGRRLSDIQFLRWDQVDLRLGRIRFAEGVTKTGAAELIQMPADLRSIMKGREAHRDPETDGGWVFPSTANPGNPWVNVHHAWARVVKRAGLERLKDFCIHGLRHNSASWASEDGASEAGVAAMGGWKDRQSIARYDHARAVKVSAPAVDAVAGRWKAASKRKVTLKSKKGGT